MKDQPLSRLTKNGEKTQIYRIKKEKEGQQHNAEIQKIIQDYYEYMSTASTNIWILRQIMDLDRYINS